MIKGECPGALPESEALHLLAVLVSGHTALCDVPAGQWDHLTDLALNHGLGPMLLWMVQGSGVDSLPCENWQAVVASARQAAAADMLYEDSMRTITRALESAGIPAVWLKGAVLARTVYPQSALRPMGDLDILVPHAQIEAAIRALKDVGYVFYNGYRPESPKKVDEEYFKRLSSYHYALIDGSSKAVLIEIHFKLLEYNNDRLLPPERLEWFFENVQSFNLNDQTACIGLSPEANLLNLVIHMILKDGDFQTNLLRNLDLYLLITRQSVDWKIVIDQAVILGWTTAVARALENNVALFHTPVPEKVFFQLAQSRPAHEDPSMLFQAGTPGYRWVCKQKDIARLSVWDKARFFFLNLFPSNGCMRSLYEVPPESAIWPYYPYRWFIQSREIVQSAKKRVSMAKSVKQ